MSENPLTAADIASSRVWTAKQIAHQICNDLAASGSMLFSNREMCEDIIEDGVKVATHRLEADNAKLRRQVEFVKRESLLAIPDRCGRHEETKCLLCNGQWYVECAPRHEKDCPNAEASK